MLAESDVTRLLISRWSGRIDEMKGHRIHALAGLAVAAAVFVLASTGVAGGAADGSAGIGALFNVGMGARALGMGGAFVAVADDGCAIYYNPAGLAFIDGNHVTSLYSDLFGAGAYVGLGYARPNLGASVVGLMSSVEGSDEFGNPTEVFSYREGAVAAGGAYAFGSVAVGGAAKLYAQGTDGNPGYGFTGDFGVMVNVPGALRFKAGAVVRNAVGSVGFHSGHEDPFQRSFAVGVSARPADGFVVAADFDITGSTGKVGAEYWLVPSVAVRAGANVNAEGEFGFAAGAGFEVGGFTIDYAYQFNPGYLPDTHWLSLGFSF